MKLSAILQRGLPMFRSFRSSPQPLHIEYKPGSDGSCSPRLLICVTQGIKQHYQTFWIPEGSTLLWKETRVERNGDVIRVALDNAMMPETLLNGQQLTNSQILKDGDFIQWKFCRAIFQADPVKDRRERMQ